MQTVIMCGGKGTRARPYTSETPKPLLPVAGEPVLGHLMRIYAAQGFTSFVLAAGHLVDAVVEFARACPRSWDVEVVDTGRETGTARRIELVADRLDRTFMANYADGLADVDLGDLLDTHRAHPGSATLTTVALPSQYGTVETDQYERVIEFREKPRLPDHRINGGYFVFDRAAFAHFRGEDLEREVLPALADAGELYTHRHPGFWKSLDTYKDAQELGQLAEEGAPWTIG